MEGHQQSDSSAQNVAHKQVDDESPGQQNVGGRPASASKGIRISLMARPTSAMSKAQEYRPSSAGRSGRRISTTPASYRQYSSRWEGSQWSVRDDWHERTYIVEPESLKSIRRAKEIAPKQHLIFRPLCTKPKPAWAERFHVVSSRDNTLCHHTRRKYFDNLPISSLDPRNSSQSGKKSAGSRPESAARRSTAGRGSLPRSSTMDDDDEDAADFNENEEAPEESLAADRRNARRRTRQAALEEKVLKLYSLANDIPRIKPYADFYMWCIKMFQNLTRCWRKLDKSSNMQLSQLEFLTSLRDYNFKGDAKMIFHCLDRDRSGSLSYYHFDPTGAKNLIKLIVWAEEVFGSLDELFRQLDVDRNGKLSPEEFKHGMQSNGFDSPEPLGHLFHLLDLDKDASITLKELDFLKKWKFDPWLRVNPDHEAAQEFKRRLLAKYRDNSVIAWNLGLDLNNAMRVSWEEFQTAGYKQGIETPQLARIWRSFDANQGGWLSLKEFDAEGYRLLVQFKELCDFKHASIRGAMKLADVNEDRLISKKEFRNILRDIGFELEEGQGTWLFNALDYNGQGVITTEKVRYLDTWSIDRDAQDEEFWKVISTCFETTRGDRKSWSSPITEFVKRSW